MGPLGDARSEGVPGIDRDLELIFAALDGLEALASDPSKAKDGAGIYDFSVRWGTLLAGRLKRLEHYHGSGELTGAQEGGYAELTRRLENSSAHLERLGLARP